jgi:outer membrane protein, heavy metal efflux system
MRNMCWIVALLALLPANVAAQNPMEHSVRPVYEGPRLTLAEAVQIATSDNLDIAALRQQVDVLRLRPGQERSLPPPMFGTQIWGWPTNTLNPWKTNFYMPMVQQDLPGRGKRQVRVALAQKDVEVGEADVAIREREVVSLVKQAYIDLSIARTALDLHISSVDVLRQIADVSQVKYATGHVSQQDVLKSVVEISKLHGDLLMLDEQAHLATARLNTLMKRPLNAPIGPLDDLTERRLDQPLEALRAAALSSKPELVAARKQVERAEAELAVARQDTKPDFAVEGGYMVMPHQTDAFLLQGSITWPKAPWSRTRFDLHAQELARQVDVAKARAQALESDVRLAVESAYVRATTAGQRAALLRTTILPQSRQTLDVSRIAYQTDQADALAMLDNQRMLLASEIDYYQALADFQHAVADLEGAIGEDLMVPTVAEVTR